MAKGAYQIGALRAISNFIPSADVKCISGASVGALNGYAYSTGNLDIAEKLWIDLCRDGIKLPIHRILRSSTVQAYITDLGEMPQAPFAPIYIPLLDIEHWDIVYRDLSTVEHELIPQYLKASIAMPVFNKAVALDETAYFDGAMIDNIPVYPTTQADLDYIICIYFDDLSYKFESTEFDNKVIKITFPSCPGGLNPSLIFKQETITQMIQEGYDFATQVMSNALAGGYDNLEHIYDTIRRANEEKPEKLRITGDVLVTNLNRITQRLTKRKLK